MGAVISIATTVACTPAPGGSDFARDIDDREAYAVYASLLPNEWIVKVAGAKTLVIQKEAATNWECMPTGQPLETGWRPVVDGFRAANRIVHNLVPGHNLGRPYRVVSSADIKSIFKEGQNDPMFGWTTFYRRYPDSGKFMLFSAVGFDGDKRRAMVYIAHHCGALCGGGEHHFLEKVNGVWREVIIPGVTRRLWVS
jgi:hypothetical protein